MINHEPHMSLALELAEKALAAGEFPVGCVIVHEDEIIATGARTGTAGQGVNEIDHAEILALKDFYQSQSGSDARDLVLYCTLEPCLMCYGAILLSGIGTIVYAYEDAMGGGTSCPLAFLPLLYRDREIEIIPGIMREQSLKLMKHFFGHPENAYWKGSYLAEYTLNQP